MILIIGPLSSPAESSRKGNFAEYASRDDKSRPFLKFRFEWNNGQDCPSFVCWRNPIWYRDRVGRREPAVPRVHEGRAKTWRPAGRVPATRTVTRARQPASSETGSWTRLPPSSASTSPSVGFVSAPLIPEIGP